MQTPPRRDSIHTPDEILQRVHNRITRLSTASRWTDLMADQLAQAQRELARTRQELGEARMLIALQFRALSADPDDMPPARLVEAWHTLTHTDRPVTVTMDGVEVTVIAAAEPQPDDALRDALHWQQLKMAFRRVRAEVRRAS